jgi:hypothetical protein
MPSALAGRPAGLPERDAPRWALPVSLVLLACCLLLVLVRLEPPAPKPATAPAAEFSAGRARQVLARLEGDEQPHPLGSLACAAVRRRIVETLTALGYTPEVQEGTGCSWKGSCGQVHNVVARLAGREPGAIALVSHYDSVAAGPGASDDLAGVAAVLETARILAREPRPRHSILLLIDEGEEEGLLGAEAFMAESPDARDLAAVVNLEARGTSGPSMMFETSGADGWLVAGWARRAGRPFATSVAAAIYSRLPYDTDLSVFKRHGVPGLNFAFIGGGARYHTPRDDLAHASDASLQHQGDNALAAVRGLAAADLGARPGGSDAFFDLLGWRVVQWPLGWTAAIALAALALQLLLVAVALRRQLFGRRELVRGLLLLPAAAAAAAAIALPAELALRVPGILSANWPAHPLPGLAVAWLAGFLLVAAIAPRLQPGYAAGRCLGVWSAWSLVALILALAAPACAYLFLVPALTAGAGGAAWLAWPAARGRSGAAAAAAIAPGVAAALLWFPVLLPLYQALGVIGLPVVFALIAILSTTVAPLLTAAGSQAGRTALRLGAAAALACVLVAVGAPAFTADSPRLLNIVFHQDAESGRARWLVGGALPVPAPLSRAAPFGPPEVPFPFAPPLLRAVAAPAEPLAAPGPVLLVIADQVVDGRRRLELRLSSPRGAPVASVYVPTSAGIEQATIDGRLVPPPPAGRFAPVPGWRGLAEVTLPAGGCVLNLVLAEIRPLAWYVIDISPGLPPAGRRLQAARPPAAASVREGDLTIFSRRLVI